MFRLELGVLLAISAALLLANGQEYDFAEEIKRQCLVPDPVGLLDCVENKVTLPYLTSWVDCTNSLGQNVKTSADIINYRCKSVWEGKEVIPEVFYIKDCVIEKTGLPAKNVSAEVLGAYKECESGSQNTRQQRVKTAPLQQQQLRVSSVEYNTPQTRTQSVAFSQPQPLRPLQAQPQLIPQQLQVPAPPLSQPPVMIRSPVQQVFLSPSPQAKMPRPPTTMNQQFAQVTQPRVQDRPMQITQQQVAVGLNQQYQPQALTRPMPQTPVAINQQYQQQIQRPQYQLQTQPPRPIQQAPVVFNQQQVQSPQFQPQIQTRPMQQVPVAFNQQQVQRSQYQPQTQARPVPIQQAPLAFSRQQSQQPQYQQALNQQFIPPSQVLGAAARIRSSTFPPYSQQYFSIYPQAPIMIQQQRGNQPALSQKTAAGPSNIAQQQIDAAGSNAYSSIVPRGPFTYSFQKSA